MHVNKSFNLNEHCENILTKANQKFVVLKRICNFVTDTNRRRFPYITYLGASSSIARQSICSSFPEKCLKWILSEQEVYKRKCNIPPLFYKPDFNNMNLFIKTIPVNRRDNI